MKLNYMKILSWIFFKKINFIVVIIIIIKQIEHLFCYMMNDFMFLNGQFSRYVYVKI